jgi:hypothetical protein
MKALCVLVLVAAAGCAAAPAKKCPEIPRAAPSAGEPAFPAFPLAALKGPHARSVKLYINADGSFHKYVVYVDRAAIPDWVHKMADKEIGTGEEMELEVEQYDDGTKVYEVTRKVAGKLLELSVRAEDRKKHYIERKDAPLSEMPAKVKTTAEGVQGFTVKRYEVKEMASGEKLHEVEGEYSGGKVSLYITEDGVIKHRFAELPAKVKVAW